jgi:hypothetical protein
MTNSNEKSWKWSEQSFVINKMISRGQMEKPDKKSG